MILLVPVIYITVPPWMDLNPTSEFRIKDWCYLVLILRLGLGNTSYLLVSLSQVLIGKNRTGYRMEYVWPSSLDNPIPAHLLNKDVLILV